jgi:parallel beta-helix repeat protein
MRLKLKNRILLFGIIALLLLVLIPQNTITTATVVENEINSSFTVFGNTLYVGGGGPGNYTKIQDAIDNATNGETVFVFDDSSPYYENVTVDKSIQLIGENKETTVIDAQKNGSVINTNGVCIKDCEENTVSKNIISYNTIGERPYNYYGAIYIRDSSYNIIIDNIIDDNDNPGLFILSSHYNEIKRNVVSLNTRCGIRLGMGYMTTIYFQKTQ